MRFCRCALYKNGNSRHPGGEMFEASTVSSGKKNLKKMSILKISRSSIVLYYCNRSHLSISDRFRSVKCCSRTAALPAPRARRPAPSNRRYRAGSGPRTRRSGSTRASWATTRRATRPSTRGAAPSWACRRVSAGPATAGENTETRATVRKPRDFFCFGIVFFYILGGGV